MKKPDHRAKLIVHEADALKSGDIADLIQWLRSVTAFLKKNGNNLSRRFSARLMRE